MSWLPFRRHTAGLPRRTTLAARLLVPICGVTAAALTALVATVATRTASLAERQATEAVSEMAARYAGEIGRDLGTPMTTARVLGQAAEGWKAGGMTSRRTADTTIRSLLERNPQVLGVWTGWEPNAFDGRDDEFARTPSSDATGRYVPYYNRGAGPTAREVLVDYDKPGDGDYYQIPKTSGKETVVEPYVYPVGGKPVLMTSLAVPITVNGRVAGVAGVDLALADVQQRVAAVRPFGTGFAALVSGGGKLLAYPDTALLGKDATGAFTNAETLAALREGRRHVGVAYHERFGGDAIRAVVPVPVAAGSAPWSLVLVVPRAAVLADAHALRAVIVGLGVLTLLALGGVVAYLVRRVTRPLTAVAERAQQLQLGCVTNLRTALEAMAHGDLSAHVEPKTPLLHFAEQDELGDVARAVDGIITDVRATVGAFGAMQGAVRGLVDETRALTAAAEAGRLAERGRAEQYAGAYRELVAGFNGTLDALQAPFAEAAVVLQRAAERDLTARMTGRYRGDHASLQTAVNTALEQLEAELAQVAGGAEQVAAAAAQIAAGGQALAGGTTEQASSLEEIGANLQEMTATAGQTAAHTREVQGLMAAATESTERGTASVARLADAVGRIQQSAESTARVVKTIDEIAFQTNLLALNAAVEAARAGDAGRGFAVVAEEVRALALRSAEAAKRTAALIDESGRSVAEGVASARAVTAGFAEIDGHVGRVAGLMREIGAAVDQQAEGVRQVNAGTELINQVTQQNAATAEESAATAEELTGQAAGLSQMMARFQLGGAAAAAPAAARAARRPAPSLARGGVPAPRPGMRAAAAAAASAGPSESARAACVIPFDEDGDDVLGGF